MNPSIAGTADTRAALDRLLAELRPKLHRYCARMTGSVIDGEDVVQEALVKAIEAFPQAESIAHPESWLFRIAHNAALDFLRRRTRQESSRVDEDPDMIVDPAIPTHDRQIAAASLRTLRCIVAARACARWRRSPRMHRCPDWRSPNARASPRMWSGSTRATSTPYATCSPTRCGSSSLRGRE